MPGRHDLKVETPNDNEIHLIRKFDAPPRLVFEALTRPDLVRRWLLGPDGWTMPVCEIDLRVGGAYRYRWRSETTGEEFGFVGVFKEITPTSRIVHTEGMDGVEGSQSLVTSLFEPQGSGTRLTMIQWFADKTTRDMVVATGMADGVGRSYERLDDVLASVA